MTRRNFDRLPIQLFFPLYKAYRIWPAKFLEEYLGQYNVQRGIKIHDPTWEEFFMEISDRLLLTRFQ